MPVSLPFTQAIATLHAAAIQRTCSAENIREILAWCTPRDFVQLIYERVIEQRSCAFLGCRADCRNRQAGLAYADSIRGRAPTGAGADTRDEDGAARLQRAATGTDEVSQQQYASRQEAQVSHGGLYCTDECLKATMYLLRQLSDVAPVMRTAGAPQFQVDVYMPAYCQEQQQPLDSPDSETQAGDGSAQTVLPVPQPPSAADAGLPPPAAAHVPARQPASALLGKFAAPSAPAASAQGDYIDGLWVPYPEQAPPAAVEKRVHFESEAEPAAADSSAAPATVQLEADQFVLPADSGLEPGQALHGFTVMPAAAAEAGQTASASALAAFADSDTDSCSDGGEEFWAPGELGTLLSRAELNLSAEAALAVWISRWESAAMIRHAGLVKPQMQDHAFGSDAHVFQQRIRAIVRSAALEICAEHPTPGLERAVQAGQLNALVSCLNVDASPAFTPASKRLLALVLYALVLIRERRGSAAPPHPHALTEAAWDALLDGTGCTYPALASHACTLAAGPELAGAHAIQTVVHRALLTPEAAAKVIQAEAAAEAAGLERRRAMVAQLPPEEQVRIALERARLADTADDAAAQLIPLP